MQKKQASQKKREKPSKHLNPEIPKEMGITQHGYRDAAEILSFELHNMFVNKLQIPAPDFVYDIETLMLYMMDACPTHLADFMTNDFTKGYLAGFVMAYIDHVQAELEMEEAEDELDASEVTD